MPRSLAKRLLRKAYCRVKSLVLIPAESLAFAFGLGSREPLYVREACARAWLRIFRPPMRSVFEAAYRRQYDRIKQALAEPPVPLVSHQPHAEWYDARVGPAPFKWRRSE